jgi:ParB/RepB/Spo0J family partition protein
MRSTETIKRKDLMMVSPSTIIIDKTENLRDSNGYGDIETLMKQILEYGVMQPIKVQRIPKTDSFKLIHGFRRMSAVNMAIERNLANDKIAFIPVILTESKYDQTNAIIDHFILNDGKALEPLEEATGVRKLMEIGMTPKEIAGRLHKTVAHVSNMKQLDKISPSIKELIKQRRISSTMALNIARENKDEVKQFEVINQSIFVAKSKGKNKVTTINSVLNSNKKPMTILEEALAIMKNENIDNNKIEFVEKLINNLSKKVDANKIVELFKNL